MKRSGVSFALLVVVLAATAGCTVLSPGDPPTLTIDNRDETKYRLTVFALPDVDAPTDVTFRATDESGERRYVGVGELQSGAAYSDVTIPADAAGSTNRTVPSTGIVTIEVSSWEPGDGWGYVVETVDDETLVAADVVACGKSGQEARATLGDGFQKRWSAECA